MGKIKGWKKNKGFNDGFAWSNQNNVEILISKGTYSGYEVHMWHHSPYQSMRTLKTKTLKQAQTKAINYMKANPNG